MMYVPPYRVLPKVPYNAYMPVSNRLQVVGFFFLVRIGSVTYYISRWILTIFSF